MTAEGSFTIHEYIEKYGDPDSPVLSLDTPVKAEDYSYFWFTAPSKGIYYFYSASNGRIDPYAELVDNEGGNILEDDGMGDLNFRIKKDLEASEKCYLITQRERNNNIFDIDTGEVKDGLSYTVNVSMTDPLSRTPDISGSALERKYMDLVLVINSVSPVENGAVKKLTDDLQAFSDKLAKTGVTLRIALVDYADITKDNGENETLIHKAPDGSIWFGTGDIEALKKELGSLRDNSEGDVPDCALDALGNLLNKDRISFDPRAGRFALLISNAGNKNDNIHGIKDMDELKNRLKAENIIVSVMNNKQYFKEFLPLTDTTGGMLMEIDNDITLNMDLFSHFMAEYADKNLKPDLTRHTAIGDTGYSVTYTDIVTYNGTAHIGEGGKASKKKSCDIMVKLFDPSGSEINSADYKLSFKKNKDASEDQAYFTIKLKKGEKSVKKALKSEKIIFRIKQLDLSKATLEAKKANEKKITGLTFTNEAGTKIKMKPFKGSKGDYEIKEANESFVTIAGKGNCTGEVKIPVK